MKRTSVLFPALALMLAGCHFGADAVPEITIDAQGLQDITFRPYAQAAFAAGDLTVIGEAGGDLGDLVTDRTAYAIANVDPSGYVALAIEPGRWGEYVRQTQASEPGWLPPPTAPSHQILISSLEDRDIGGSPPEALCAYLDPASDWTPPECQGPITVVVAGHTYHALVEPESKKVLAVLTFARSELEPAGLLEQVDPRLLGGGDVGPTAYRIRGADAADASDAVVVPIGVGLDARYAVFLPEGSSAMPAGLCAHVDSRMAQQVSCATSSGGRSQAAIDASRRHEHLWYSNEIPAYRFTIEIRCDCPDEAHGPFTVTVVNSDMVDSVVLGSEQISADDDRAAFAPKRMNEAFEQVERYASAPSFKVDYDEKLGYPRRLDADTTPGTPGGVYGFTITRFELTQ